MTLAELYRQQESRSVDAVYNEAHASLTDRSHRAMRAYIKTDRSPLMEAVARSIIVNDLADAVVRQVLDDA